LGTNYTLYANGSKNIRISSSRSFLRKQLWRKEENEKENLRGEGMGRIDKTPSPPFCSSSVLFNPEKKKEGKEG